MKTQHVTLPGLQLAAAAFFAAAAEANTFCADPAGKVVATANCLGADKANFKLVEFNGDLKVGDDVPNDPSNPVARDINSGLVSGGFGRRQDCDPNTEDCGGRAPIGG